MKIMLPKYMYGLILCLVGYGVVSTESFNYLFWGDYVTSSHKALDKLILTEEFLSLTLQIKSCTFNFRW